MYVYKIELEIVKKTKDGRDCTVIKMRTALFLPAATLKARPVCIQVLEGTALKNWNFLSSEK